MGETMMIQPGPLGVSTEFPQAYRLARRKGELVLQAMWRVVYYEYGHRVEDDEWRDVPTVEVGGDG